MKSSSSNYQKTRQVILNLLELMVQSGHFSRNPDLWKIYIDSATEQIEEIYQEKCTCPTPRSGTERHYSYCPKGGTAFTDLASTNLNDDTGIANPPSREGLK